jgi:hypothetical protein
LRSSCCSLAVLYNTPTLKDVCSGLQVMKREVAEAVSAEAVAHGGEYFELEMMISALGHGYRVVEVPVSSRPGPVDTPSPDPLFTGFAMIAVVTRRWLRDSLPRERQHAERVE